MLLDLIEDYCNRPGYQGFSDFINSAFNIEKAKAICNVALKTLNEKRCNDIKASNYLWIERTENSTSEENVRKVERTYIPSEHIGLYEKYGYHYLKDIVNFGNGTDRLYVKELR